ncbi:DUF443 family protein [Streptococcus pantholopis]|uniref:Tandem five-TM protein n=1 Tax=Streptococcus pantholopis TaxID=1811193 RepID=A0A172Q541_9STRE|nr:DUF443 family protein [Streptococcus pantholopis]AND78542.1 hypothetical protein A0O21_00155 [Streptococcus pantholopis]
MSFDQYNIRYFLLETDEKYYIFDRKSSFIGYFFAPLNALTPKNAYELSSEQYQSLLASIIEKRQLPPSGLLRGSLRLAAVMWANILARQVFNYLDTDYSLSVNLILLSISMILSMLLIHLINKQAKNGLEKVIKLSNLRRRKIRVIPSLTPQLIKTGFLGLAMFLLMLAAMYVYILSGNLIFVLLLPVLELIVLIAAYFPYFEKMTVKAVKK